DEPEFHDRFFKPFYDYHLKGIDNGVMDEPPVTLFVRGLNEYRDEAEWPLARAEYVSYYLSGDPSGSVTSLNDGSLTTDAPGTNAEPTSYDYPDPQWGLGVVAMGPFGPDPAARVLTFTSPPLDRDTEVTGSLLLELFAASDQPDTDFIVKLSDQLPQSDDERAQGRQPAFAPVSKGWLAASHRDKDDERSTEIRPFYRHQERQPLSAGETYRFEIEVHPIAHIFKAGHRIRLEISNGDSPLTDAVFTHQYMPHKHGRDTLFHDAEHPSRLLLPMIPA
ncbi:MAG: CocE/NonD family hydrolase, partial [Alphaproteobacteria bacterium]|nr:CocE/NonD family hydrolase [Alphaproteobacteria bacterium]